MEFQGQVVVLVVVLGVVQVFYFFVFVFQVEVQQVDLCFFVEFEGGQVNVYVEWQVFGMYLVEYWVGMVQVVEVVELLDQFGVLYGWVDWVVQGDYVVIVVGVYEESVVVFMEEQGFVVGQGQVVIWLV